MNNVDLYNAVISGISGATQNFRSGVTSNANYTLLGDRAVILANSVDSAIAPTTVTQADVGLLSQIVSGLDFNRSLLGTTPDYNSIASDIIKMWTELRGRTLPSPTSIPITNVETIADLRNLTSSPALVFVDRYSVAGTSQGGGWFELITAVTPDNGVTLFVNAIGRTYQRAGSADNGTLLLEWGGAVGDKVHDDAAAITRVTALQNLYSTISGVKGKTYYITYGSTIHNSKLTLKDIHLYMPAPSTRLVTMPGMATDFDSMFLVYNGSSFTIIDHMLQPDANNVKDLKIINCEFSAAGSLGSPLLLRSAAIGLFGVDGIEIRDCLFHNLSREAIVGNGYTANAKIHDNTFVDMNHDGISLELYDSYVYENTFLNVWAATEMGTVNTIVYHNEILATAPVTAAFWLAINAQELYLDIILDNNYIQGPIIYPILISNSGSLLGPALIKRQEIIRNEIACGSNTAVGTQVIWCQSSTGGEIIIEDNIIDATGIANNAGAVFRIEGAGVARIQSISSNICIIPNGFLYSLVQCDANDSQTYFYDNIVDFCGTGSFRVGPIDLSGRTYRSAAVLNSANPELVRIARNSIGLLTPTDDAVGATVLQLADHQFIDTTSPSKTITQIYTTTTPTLSNKSVSSLIRLPMSANIITSTGVDSLIAPGEDVTFTPNGAGKVICGTDSAIRVLNKCWPLKTLPYGAWLADHRVTSSAGDVSSWRSIIGDLELTVPAGDATPPSLSNGWTDGRATILFDGVKDRLICTALDNRFNGEETPITVIMAFEFVAAAPTATLFAVGQYGASAATALRADFVSTVSVFLTRITGGVPININQPALNSNKVVAGFRLRSDKFLAVTQYGSQVTADASAGTALANQNAISIGDIISPTAVFPANVNVRAIFLTGATNDSQLNSCIQFVENYV